MDRMNERTNDKASTITLAHAPRVNKYRASTVTLAHAPRVNKLDNSSNRIHAVRPARIVPLLRLVASYPAINVRNEMNE